MHGSPTANNPEFREAFVRKCHRLVGQAYLSLDCASFRASEETEITGELARKMEEILDRIPSPRGMRNFVVLDDPPQNTGKRRGRKRLRVDIEIRDIQTGPKPRFRFEAKRMTSKRSVAKYLGKDGLQMYTRGEYAAEQDDAGMLGYVQIDEPGIWADKLGASLKEGSVEYAISAGGEWTPCAITAELSFSFRSRHDRTSVGRSMVIFHTLLNFK